MKQSLLHRLITTAFLTLALASQSFAAGFHYQLDLTAKLVSNAEGKLQAIQMSWLYDKELSSILMDGEDLSESKRDATLKRRAADILSGLKDAKYFTIALLDQKALKFNKVEHYKLRLIKESRLQMNLTLPLAQPQTLKGHELALIVTDDSGVGLATFIDTNHMLLGESFSKICQAPKLLQKKQAEVDGHAQVVETMTISCRQ